MVENPLLVVGLDAVTLELIDELSDEGSFLRGMREDGVVSELEATHPPWTGSAWPSIYTGQDASHHGVFDFFDYSTAYPDAAETVSREDVDAPALWNYLSARGLTSVVLNVPVTHPAEQIDGAVVPGYLAPADEPGHPEGIRDDISERIGDDYQIYARDSDRSTVEAYEDVMEDRLVAARQLLETVDWDFAFLQLQKTDSIFHESSSTSDFRRIYEKADEFLETVCSVAPDDTNVIVCSDHGMGSVTGYTVYVNQILHEHGFVEPSAETTNSEIGHETGGSESESSTVGTVARGVIDAASTVGVSPGSLYRLAQTLGLDGFVLEMLPDDFHHSIAEGVDWEHSAAFCRRESEQGIRINLRGRDPNGQVPPEEYEATRSELIDILSNVETPEGAPVFDWVEPREEVYDGPYAEEACDVLFRLSDMNHRASTQLYGTAMTPLDTYHHKERGVLMAAGPDIPSASGTSVVSALDVAPAVFELLGVPMPERLQGTVPEQLRVRDVSREQYGEVSYGQAEAYSQDQSEVRDRLSNLGYL